MTRINVVPPSRLTDQHLLAEYRELPRIFGLSRAWVDAGKPGEIPDSYRLGAGHVRFFYPLTAWLVWRQCALVAECLDRGFTPAHTEPMISVPGADDDWEPICGAYSLNLSRLRERLHERPDFYRHRGVVVGPDFYGEC